MELLGIFVGEKAVKLIQSLDPNKIEATRGRVAGDQITTQNSEAAQKSPVWDSVSVSGYVMHQKDNWTIVSLDDVLNYWR